MKNLILKDIRKRYNGFELYIKNLNFNNGLIYVITGPNGSGKTTLLEIISSMDSDYEGRIYIGESIISGLNRKECFEFRKRVGFLKQNSFLFNNTVFYNIIYGLRARGVSVKEAGIKAEHISKRLRLLHLYKRDVNDLSGGEKQRVRLAQILVFEPELILLDEPVAGVDRFSSKLIENLIKDIGGLKENIIIITAHEPYQAYKFSENVICLNNGKITDFVHENIFFGQVYSDSDGMKYIEPKEGVKIFLNTDENETVHVAIDPETVILTKKFMLSSARNVFEGTVKRIEEFGPNARIFINAGIEFCSVITKRSLCEMELTINSEVFLNFKANSVKIL